MGCPAQFTQPEHFRARAQPERPECSARMEFPSPARIIRRYPSEPPAPCGRAGDAVPFFTHAALGRTVRPAGTETPLSMANRNLIHQINIDDLEADLDL